MKKHGMKKKSSGKRMPRTMTAIVRKIMGKMARKARGILMSC